MINLTAQQTQELRLETTQIIHRPRARKHHEVKIPELKVPKPVQEALAVLARAVLDNNVSYREATEAMQTKLVITAIQDKHGVVDQAAKTLRMNVGWAWKILNGLAFRGKAHR
ncbi:MAG TPA: hypothetical protein VFB79_23245 [Candidatus Angelobacter sp.]|nr:hypothetical protein [Candidatus Angelobacter sp.]